MKLEYTFGEIESLLTSKKSINPDFIALISTDSRKLLTGKNVLFFALKGNFRDGSDYIEDAYQTGVRHFVISSSISTSKYKGAHFILVEDTLTALQKLAIYHRDKFDIPVIAITGSYGKTTTKEWLSQILASKFEVTKSPKSYNSELGVALSLLELKKSTEIAVIEVGIGERGHMDRMRLVIKPTHGILTTMGVAHLSFFENEAELIAEKLSLFQDLTEANIYKVDALEPVNNLGQGIQKNLNSIVAICKDFGFSDAEIEQSITQLPQVSMRLESYDGINNNKIINDTYRFNTNSLRFALEYQLTAPYQLETVIILDTSELTDKEIQESRVIIREFEPIKAIFISKEEPEFNTPESSSILLTGRGNFIREVAQDIRKHHHLTYLEIDLNAIRKNIQFFKSKLRKETQLLCMLKASAYGSDAKTIGPFLENIGINYLGVAYPSEGIELRKSGIESPILVLNCDKHSFATCIKHKLEPAIFDIDDLQYLIGVLIAKDISNYPIHLKLETGMNRLGFSQEEFKQLMLLINGQPEVYVKSVYSHLVESEVINSAFTRQQIKIFTDLAERISNELPYPITRHLLNTNGIINYADAQFEMVRLGIGIYGISGQTSLSPAINWISSVSQIKIILPGESVGYNRRFIAKERTLVAVIPVGYADGFSRNLSEGKGGVYINGNYCKTIGSVCMDMIMVEIDNSVVKGDKVEIIGNHQSIEEFAKKIGTIPYEILTNFSQRIERIYIND